MTSTSDTTSVRSVDPDLYRFDGDNVSLLGSRSVGSGELLWPRRLRSPVDGGAVQDVELAPAGTIWSWTFVHVPWPGSKPPDPGAEQGYAVGLIDLDDNGPRVIGALVGPADQWSVGQRVRAVPLPFRTGDTGVEAVLGFAPSGVKR
ncbi:Zn-ribbon domain-containing OB-fold protein [Mycobacterium sp. NPDC003449]